MNTLLIIIFVLAYASIALEHPFRVNKSAPALIGAGLLWTVYAVFTGGVAAMGIEKIEFFWYVRRISLLALIGYISGAVVYVLLH
jgi:hypothetical protein